MATKDRVKITYSFSMFQAKSSYKNTFFVKNTNIVKKQITRLERTFLLNYRLSLDVF